MTAKRNTEYRFRASLLPVGSEYCVEVPPRITRALAARGRTPVAVRMDHGFTFNATLRPRAGHPHRLFLNEQAREGQKSGQVSLRVAPVAADRAVETPRDLLLALREADVLDTWQLLPAGKREHIVGYIEQAAREKTRVKRITQAVEVAERQRERRLAKRGR